MVNAARFFSAVGVGVRLPILLPLVPPFTLLLGQTLPVFSAVSVGVRLLIILLLVPPFTLRRG